MKGLNNEYYLSRNYLKEYATAGSIFLDYRSDFSDDFLIIYGHRMSYGGMFTDITKFRDSNFFEEHKSGELFIGENKVIFEIIAFSVVRADNREIFDMKADALENVMQQAVNARKLGNGRFILLSTCDAHNKAMRDVLLARIIE